MPKKRRENPPNIWWNGNFALSLSPKSQIHNDMNNRIPTREELLLRVEASKERKRKRLAEMEVRARELFKERTGDEPKFVYSL